MKMESERMRGGGLTAGPSTSQNHWQANDSAALGRTKWRESMGLDSSRQHSPRQKAGDGRSTFEDRIFAQLSSKQRGELAEMMFMVKAAKMGMATAKPYGDSRRYDFIVDVGPRLWKVQVKSSSALQYGSYMINLQRNANGETIPYDPAEIDFVVGYVMPCDAWFVMPVEVLAGQKTAKLCLHGNGRSGRLGKYWEAWGLMLMKWPRSN